MRLIVDIPNSLYANLAKIGNGSIAGKRIVECVKDGKPYKVDTLDKIHSDVFKLRPLSTEGECLINTVLQIIEKYMEGEQK